MRGFHRCAIPLYREHVIKATNELEKHACVEPGSIRFDGSLVHYTIDLVRLSPGDAPAVELVIRRAVEAAIRA